jgi:hypothetical protein
MTSFDKLIVKPAKIQIPQFDITFLETDNSLIMMKILTVQLTVPPTLTHLIV